MDAEHPEVVVIGEALAEFSAAQPLTEASGFRLSFSGDALNAAVAAATAGARVALVTRTGADEFGDRLVRFAAGHGIDTRWIGRGPGPTGAYAVGADPGGTRDFVYLRSGSAASHLSPADLDAAPVATAPVILLSGITAALSDSCAATVAHAARIARGAVVYDPNFRRRLTRERDARAVLTAIAPYTAVLTPSCPADSGALLGTSDPGRAAAACLELGAAAAAVTCGADGVRVSTARGRWLHVPAAPAHEVVDSTGAGDAFAGTLAARLARGADLAAAVRTGTAAAALCLADQGGTGWVAADGVRELLDSA